MSLLVTGSLQAQVSTGDPIPKPFVISREGRSINLANESYKYLSALRQGDAFDVFEDCLPGKYYVAFQLLYTNDLNTTVNWSCDLGVTLMHGPDSVWTKSLGLSMIDQTFVATIFHDSLISCTDNYSFIINSKDSVGNVSGDIVFNILLYKAPEVLDASADFFSLEADNFMGQTNVFWGSSTEPQAYDLEWVFIAGHEGFTGTTARSAFKFKEPARVTVKESQYNYITNYPEGRIWYRVRKVGYDPQYPEHRIIGQWFYSNDASVITNHQPDKNWQQQTVFAEEGKYKKVMTYFDGTLRQRQSLTNLSTQQATLVGETLYDFEGRKSTDILPVPVADVSLKYKPDFNRFQAIDALMTGNTSLTRNKFHYDNYKAMNSLISVASGAGKYYSPANDQFVSSSEDFTGTNYIPEGEGYVYSQVEYTRDGTGRVRRQSGVGKEFQMDGSHATRYVYSTPAEEELIRLFGSNVGVSTHYKKNLVVDPNGQVSVSYLDQEGRVIATALAGDNPANVKPLESLTTLSAESVTFNMLDRQRVEGTVLTASKKILNVVPNTLYSFHYDAALLASEVEGFGCKECTFDLTITITDPDGVLVNLASVPGNQSVGQPAYERNNITARNCVTPLFINGIEFTRNLTEIGDYTITKNIVAHDLSVEEMQTIIERDTAIQRRMEEIRSSYVVDASNCEICTSDCPGAEDVIDEAIEETAELDCENMYRQIISYYTDSHPDNPEYEPTQTEIEAHGLYCQYVLCVKDNAGDVFDKQIARISGWNSAVEAGYDNPSNLVNLLDPFFSNNSLSGFNFKPHMLGLLNNVVLTADLRGPVNNVTDPDNTAFYVNSEGNPDPEGKHILYNDLMRHRSEYSPQQYAEELDRQHWLMFKNFYIEAKRKTKLEKIPFYIGCDSARHSLQAINNLAEIDTDEEMTAFGNANGLSDTVSVEELESSYLSIESECNATFSAADSITIRTNLEAYFNSHPKNFLRLILIEDVSRDSSLQVIQTILYSNYTCNLYSVALNDPLTCLRDTILYSESDSIYYGEVYQESEEFFSRSSAVNASSAEDISNQAIVADRIANVPTGLSPIPEIGLVQQPKVTKRTALRSTGSMTLTSTPPMPDELEYQALVDLFNSTNGPNWQRKDNWQSNPNTRQDVSQWYGITTDTDGHVIELNLHLNNLAGTLPASIGNLIYLQKLDLSAARFTGSIPTSIGNLTNLQHLSLSGDKFTGPIPSELGNLVNLRILILSENEFFTPLPSTIGNLVNLVQLDVSNSRITGSIPNSFGNLTNLQYLAMQINRLSGNLPAEIGNLKKLYRIILHNNLLTGTIPVELGSIDSLQQLDLHNNGLTGPIPAQIGNLSTLQELQLSNNRFRNTSIPPELGRLTNLRILDVGYCDLGGTIPAELGNLVNLTHLSVFFNFLIEGPIPSSLENLVKLKQLILGGNKLSGTIPSGIGNLVNLENLDLFANELTGEIPPSIGSLVKLITFRASGNHLSGTIPSTIGNLNKLQSLDLFRNELIGPLPSQLGGMVAIQNINLSENKIDGAIPSSFGNLTTLRDLRLNSNQLADPIPASLGSITNLLTLDLSGNKFSGHISPAIGNPSNVWITLTSNYLTFEDINDVVQNFHGRLIQYDAQNLVDLTDTLVVSPGESITLVANVDRDVVPGCKYQWFGPAGFITEISENNHTVTIQNVTGANAGNYLYKITNERAPLLTLESTPRVVGVYTRATHVCLEYDPNNPTIALYNAEIDWAAEVAKCMANAAAQDSALVKYAIDKLIEEHTTNFYTSFHTNCLKNVTENFTYSFVPKEYHYTLYYYDQAGNLEQTVPPNGVHPFTNAQVTAFMNSILTDNPPHTLLTLYQYNSLNQLVYQKTPDAGESRFYYNDKGQIRLSQNAQQFIDTRYSYTKYDALSRIVEVGEMETTAPVDTLITKLDSIQFPVADTYTLTDVTRTHYDFGKESMQATFPQESLRNRVAWVEVLDKGKTDTTATYYSYDIHGNVKALLQQQPGLGFKRTDYLYDLVSGKVNYVMYQYGESDQFIHRYAYDADNRITEVSTSSDGYLWNRDASYKYYLHGPLARTELGEYRVQGLDYYYTLQGWIKGVNMPFAGDPGRDGEPGDNTNFLVGRDACSYTLGYFINDYKSIKNNAVLSDTRDQLWSRFSETITGTPLSPGEGSGVRPGLFNGNISWMVTDLAKIGEINNYRAKGMQAMLYKYDQLHRIVTSRSLTDYDSLGQTGFAPRTTPQSAYAYDEDYTYDGNGNLLTLQRRNELGILADDFHYKYTANTNRLREVKPLNADLVISSGALVSNTRLYNNITVNGSAYVRAGSMVELKALQNIFVAPDFRAPDGADFHATLVDGALPIDDVYQYDAIGNLVKNLESNTTITWTPYGKVREVRSDSMTVSFRYDAMGNRIEKRITPLSPGEGSGVRLTHYVRDASGNVMAIYKDTTLIEQPLYGSSRLGMYGGGRRAGYRTLGKKKYEIVNHLGNVMVVISDRVKMDNNMQAVVVSTSDYYPFGLEMKGRVWNDSTDYRFGFNGKEKDDKGEFGSTVYDYGFRIYNPSIGRFLSVDPLTKKYPELTPYQFAGNMPIKYIDLDGLEPANNPTDPANQDGRNPTSTINSIYKESGGDENFKNNFLNYARGSYDADATVSGITSKPGYSSDSKDGADKYNHWVNSNGVFKADEYTNFSTRDFSNFLLGTLITGVGPENIEFPTNGIVSNYLKDAGIVNDALNSWYALNLGQNSLMGGQAEYSGNKHNPGSFLMNGPFHPETFLGSASLMITPINDKEVMVKIFNVTSLTSGDFAKHLPWNNYPMSVVRDPSKTSASGANNYGNISQTYSFTLPIDFERLKK